MKAIDARPGKKVTWGSGTGVAEVIEAQIGDPTTVGGGKIKMKVIYPITDALGTKWERGATYWLDASCVDYLH